jgi:hypothetical protein
MLNEGTVMRRWIVQDREGREIYLTEERWEHIVTGHPELREHLDDVLMTVRQGHRQQQPHDPQAYVYRKPCSSLRPPYNGILVVVVFRLQADSDGRWQPNNFVITAWGIVMRRHERSG